MRRERHWHHYDTIYLRGNCIHSSPGCSSSDPLTLVAPLLPSWRLKIVLLEGCQKVFPVLSPSSFSATVVCVLIYLAARSWQLRSFILTDSSSAAHIHQERGWMTAPATAGVITQDKAAVSPDSCIRSGKSIRPTGFVKSKLLLSLRERVTCATWLMTLQVMAICCLIWNALAPSAVVINAKYLSCVRVVKAKLHVCVRRASPCCRASRFHRVLKCRKLAAKPTCAQRRKYSLESPRQKICIICVICVIYVICSKACAVLMSRTATLRLNH